MPKLTVTCYVVFGRYTWKTCFSKGGMGLGERGGKETWRKGRGSGNCSRDVIYEKKNKQISKFYKPKQGGVHYG